MRKSIAVILIAVGVLVSIVAWPSLPDTLPTHWDADGRVDGTSPKLVALFLLPSIAAALLAGLTFLPRIDPRHENYRKFQGSYDLMVTMFVAMLIAIHLTTVASALGAAIPVAKVVSASLGVFLMAIGNFLPRARPNFFLGIRTPWTLSSDTVWTRTHRVGGYALVAVGLLQLAVAFIGGPQAQLGTVAIIVAISLSLVAYSFVLWQREQRPE